MGYQIRQQLAVEVLQLSTRIKPAAADSFVDFRRVSDDLWNEHLSYETPAMICIRAIYESIETVLARGIRPTAANALPARPQVRVKRCNPAILINVNGLKRSSGCTNPNGDTASCSGERSLISDRLVGLRGSRPAHYRKRTRNDAFFCVRCPS